jgi:hypothetical protein
MELREFEKMMKQFSQRLAKDPEAAKLLVRVLSDTAGIRNSG